jgi:hypothetical protein
MQRVYLGTLQAANSQLSTSSLVGIQRRFQLHARASPCDKTAFFPSEIHAPISSCLTHGMVQAALKRSILEMQHPSNDNHHHL